MVRWPFPGERGFAAVEALFWLAIVGAVMGVAAFIGLRAHNDDLTPEQQAYVRAVATQQALAYVAAVATQQAEAPPPALDPPPARPAAVSAAPIVPAAPTTPPLAAPPAQTRPEPPASQVPPAAPPPAPPPPPPAPPTVIPPMAACVGFMNGNTSTGEEQCRQIAADPGTNRDVVACITAVLARTQFSQQGKHDCTQAALHTRDAFLQDCFLGLADLSHFGRRACTQYYNRFANP